MKKYSIPVFLLATLILLLSLSSLTSCAVPSAVYHVNDMLSYGCVFGDEFYYDFGAGRVIYSTPDGIKEGLCRDPLCMHGFSESSCPDGTLTGGGGPHFTTDGIKLYCNTPIPFQHALMRRIYSISPDGTDMKMLYEFEGTGNNGMDLVIADGFLYFEEGHYNEDYDRSAGYLDISDQYSFIVRIPITGGRAEQVTKERGEIGSHFDADGKTLVRAFAEAGEIERTDLKTGNTERIPLPDTFLGVFPHLIDGTLYLTAYVPQSVEAECLDGRTIPYHWERWFLYRFTDGGWVMLAESETRFVFAGDEIWTVREGRPEYLGTQAYPTGKGSETADWDIFDTHANRIMKINLKTEEMTEATLGEGVGEGESVYNLFGVGEHVVYAVLSDPRRQIEGELSRWQVCLDREDLSVIWRQ